MRNAVADSLWVGCGNERLKGVDWGAPPRELRLRGWEELKGGILREFRD